ncbi:Phosphoglycerate mutase-like protein AT74 [Glycine soja]|uniref:Phosphoglycerate mutase-like protein AT74 n=1 Tax=Glycine soja TaxID=3848 RepID=A0A445I443_GLYSO|nr:Phosphoglycerate mutase-like protein AT74 [Glycine soja]
MRHGKSQGNQDTATYTTTPDHNIQLTVQGMAQALHTGEHLHRVMGSDGCSPDWRVQFYVFPYVHTQSMFHELRKCFLKKRVIGVREELRVRERDFRNFQVKERMKKGILYELMGSVEDVRNGFWIFNSKTV